MGGRFAVITFGCWLNKADSDIVITRLRSLAGSTRRMWGLLT
ncbi:hypothetical protein [Vulcanisaeta sp. JCM 16159]